MYQFCRIPFGLKTAGSGFIRALSFALEDEFNANISCYIDDISIGTKSVEEHLSVLNGIFRRLTEYNFTQKLSKCEFFRKQVSFLGFNVSRTGITLEPKILETIINFEPPKNKKQLQQFIGVCNYYRQFNVKHSQSIDQLRDLLTKDKVWQWTHEHSKAFDTLKRDFRDCITLKHVIPNSEFRLQTDASDRGISGILYQIDASGDHNVVDIVSRCLTRPEINYTTTE